MGELHAVIEALARYVVDSEDDALDEACRSVQALGANCDIATLMQGLARLKSQRADPLRLALAERRLRGVLGLSMHPGPICRAAP